MSLSKNWLIQDRVIKVDIEGEVTSDDLLGFNDEMEAAVASGTAPVHVIADITGLDKVSVGPQAAIKGSQYMKQPNIGIIVLAGATGLVDALIPVVSAVIPMNLKRAANADAALELLQSEDSTI